MSSGKVYLVGAGPGDPGLLTLRGRQCLDVADAVVYDALVNPVLLDHAPRAERVYVGKKSDRHSLPQAEIQRILVDYARRGLNVVRLKGGDPFVFGRGGEEALALVAAGIPFEVVPGITAGLAAAAYAGIPVTHRGLAAGVTLVTGHLSGEEKALDIDFARLSPGNTLVFYMGVAALPRIREGLRANGWRDDTPCAVVEWGTYARQRTVSGTLADIERRVAEAGIEAPAVIIAGAVAGLREKLAWFESRPLFELRVAVTHSSRGNESLEGRLRALGADVFVCPTVEVQQESRPEGIEELGGYDWIVLASANAARSVFAALDAAGRDARYLGGVKICAVGASTLAALEQRYLRADATPGNYTPEAAVAAMEALGSLAGSRVLIPRADVARASLAGALEARGAAVTETVAYHMELPAGAAGAMSGLVEFKPGLVVFTNAAAVRNLSELLSAEEMAALTREAAVASIGPVTSRAAEAAGFRVAVEPGLHDVAHLVEAVCGWWSGKEG
ncbi:MAG: uroporphyrinogen-III C-methyltransferase [Candidatus Hydrogenedentes bacterium]|nr:uroporphyrinogen-III C-methyltransferase [Candidatus Hydrogenedentota bacterium]